ncbi:gustatory receptor for sugar taste 43a-like [Photinus pyralis]|uniref:gustatory receptor for sugar taste 43a-like n=1 Tax=Photinus pyralis TaxID=7054 RepID=UPI00126764C2|nr:gustatory receptor for sugar taste 43a-like [Photinus pyralis]
MNEVDSIIVISDAKRARRVSILRLCTVLTAATAILISDLAMWWTIGDQSQGSDFLIGNYVPFYTSYYVILFLECQYWHLLYCIKRRLQLLNACLKINGVTPEDAIRGVINKPFSLFRKTQKSEPKVISVIDALGRQKTIVDIFFIRNAGKLQDKSVNDYIVKLTRVYLKLCDAADCVNNCCGLSILIILTSCLLHLVVTPYFLVLEILGRKNVLVATIQMVWIFTHLTRLVIIVEACYACTSEARKIRPSICKLLCYDFDEDTRKQLELFAAELNHRQIEFTACGLVRIDRALITSVRIRRGYEYLSHTIFSKGIFGHGNATFNPAPIQ